MNRKDRASQEKERAITGLLGQTTASAILSIYVGT